MRAWVSIFFIFFAVVLAACGPKTLDQKMKYGEKVVAEADGHLQAAEKLLRALEPEKADDELREARELLAEPDATLSPEAELVRGRLDELTALLPSVRDQRRQRDLDEAVRERRSKIGPILQAMKDAVEPLSGKGLDEQTLKRAKSATEDLSDELDDDMKELETRDQDFASYLKRARAEMSKAKDEIALAESKLGFVSGTIATRDAASEKWKAAKAERDPAKKVDALTEVVAEFGSCAKSAASYSSKPALAKAPIFVRGAPVMAESVASGCETSKASATKELDAAKKTLAAQKAKDEAARKKAEAAEAAKRKKEEAAEAARKKKEAAAEAAKKKKEEAAEAARKKKEAAAEAARKKAEAAAKSKKKK